MGDGIFLQRWELNFPARHGDISSNDLPQTRIERLEGPRWEICFTNVRKTVHFRAQRVDGGPEIQIELPVKFQAFSVAFWKIRRCVCYDLEESNVSTVMLAY